MPSLCQACGALPRSVEQERCSCGAGMVEMSSEDLDPKPQEDAVGVYKDAHGRTWYPIGALELSDEEKAQCDAWVDDGPIAEVTAGEIREAIANTDRHQLQALGSLNVTTRTDDEGVVWLEAWDPGVQQGWGHLAWYRHQGVWRLGLGGQVFASAPEAIRALREAHPAIADHDLRAIYQHPGDDKCACHGQWGACATCGGVGYV